MAISSTITGQYSVGSHRKVCGTYTLASGDTSGTIATGLAGVIEYSARQTDVTDATDSGYRVTESSGTLTIRVPGGCRAAHSGVWQAVGK